MTIYNAVMTKKSMTCFIFQQAFVLNPATIKCYGRRTFLKGVCLCASVMYNLRSISANLLHWLECATIKDVSCDVQDQSIAT